MFWDQPLHPAWVWTSGGQEAAAHVRAMEMAPPPLFLPTFRPCAQLGSQCGEGPLGGGRKAGRAQDHSGGGGEDSMLGGTGLGWLCSETSHLHKVTGFACVASMLI